MAWRRRFTEHPASVDETYGEHLRVALHFSGQLAVASAAAAVHALAPWLCTRSASTKVAQLNVEMTSGARAPKPAAGNVTGSPPPLAEAS
ncbi:MAG: DUF6356 family protein [Acidimicrobiia bacterium]|nr:DUF6356 family protein [Acidimicrobiia bacterium]